MCLAKELSFKNSKLLVFFPGLMRGTKVIRFAKHLCSFSALGGHSFLLNILTWLKTSTSLDLLEFYASNLLLILGTLAARIILSHIVKCSKIIY